MCPVWRLMFDRHWTIRELCGRGVRDSCERHFRELPENQMDCGKRRYSSFGKKLNCIFDDYVYFQFPWIEMYFTIATGSDTGLVRKTADIVHISPHLLFELLFLGKSYWQQSRSCSSNRYWTSLLESCVIPREFQGRAVATILQVHLMPTVELDRTSSRFRRFSFYESTRVE